MIPLSRDIEKNALLQKHEIRRHIEQGKLIKGFPIVDSNNPKHIEQIAGNELRVLKTYAPGLDFCANIIDRIQQTGDVARYIKDISKDYYSLKITETTWREYFSHCGDHNTRFNLAKMIMKDFQTGIILLPIYDKTHGRGVERRAPFRIMAEKYYADGTKYRELYLAKAVFKSLVTGECFNGGDGFGKIPANLYPLLTGPDTGVLQSYNPIYKLNVHGLMKNTNKKKAINLPRQEFLETIVPEYVDKNGQLKISSADLHDSLIKQTRAVLDKIPEGQLVKNFFIGRGEGMSTIYFREDPLA